MTSASSTPVIATPATSTPSSRPGTPNLSTPPTAAVSDKVQDDTSKLRLFVSLLKKYAYKNTAVMAKQNEDSWSKRDTVTDIGALIDSLVSLTSPPFAFLFLRS